MEPENRCILVNEAGGCQDGDTCADASVQRLVFVPAEWERWRGLVGGDGRSEEHGIAEERQTSEGGKDEEKPTMDEG